MCLPHIVTAMQESLLLDPPSLSEDTEMNTPIALNPYVMNGETIQTVNARDIHAFLEVGKDFSTWVKAQIERARLVENRDYLVVPQKGEQQFQGVKDRIDYFLTLEAGKHFAMMSNTDKGFEVREYFIECERRAKSASVALNPANMSRLQLLEMAMQAEQERLSLEAKVEEMLPDVRAFERIGKTDGLLNVTEAAKALSMQPKALFRWLQAHEWIYRRAGGKNWLGYQRRVQTGLLDHKVTPVERGDGSEKMVEQVMITGKGLSRLAKDLDRDTQSHLPV
jgi:phage anti-repressor protein